MLCSLLKVELSNPQAELRILEVFYHKIYKVSSSMKSSSSTILLSQESCVVTVLSRINAHGCTHMADLVDL